MILSSWVGNNLHMLNLDVDEVFNEGDFVGIRFTKDDYVVSDPRCIEVRCEGGKYRKSDGSYGICYRCDGRGYITPDKAVRNQQHDYYKNRERVDA